MLLEAFSFRFKFRLEVRSFFLAGIQSFEDGVIFLGLFLEIAEVASEEWKVFLELVESSVCRILGGNYKCFSR